MRATPGISTSPEAITTTYSSIGNQPGTCAWNSLRGEVPDPGDDQHATQDPSQHRTGTGAAESS